MLHPWSILFTVWLDDSLDDSFVLKVWSHLTILCQLELFELVFFYAYPPATCCRPFCSWSSRTRTKLQMPSKMMSCVPVLLSTVNFKTRTRVPRKHLQLSILWCWEVLHLRLATTKCLNQRRRQTFPLPVAKNFISLKPRRWRLRHICWNEANGKCLWLDIWSCGFGPGLQRSCRVRYFDLLYSHSSYFTIHWQYTIPSTVDFMFFFWKITSARFSNPIGPIQARNFCRSFTENPLCLLARVLSTWPAQDNMIYLHLLSSFIRI